ncbi:MAG: CcoQ/FixQ family Cbb3-type cytochrome c oxidase assembly chaperone [Flavobacteriales bacterium]|nr:CcoQ/FixQ family Cbb3-type cytochrome c oxidase assembly chaperone [Flavobacteriales bacterium]
MYKEVAQHIPNVSIYPVISLVIFFSFFLILLLVVITKDKKVIDILKHLPIDDQKTKQ